MSQEKKTESTKDLKKDRMIFGISYNVLLLGFVSLFTDISSEMITAILPLFILTIASTNAIIALGFIDGISNAIANLVKGLSGYLSDKLKQRKSIVLLGYTVSNIAKPFIGLQSNWLGVLGLKATDRIGKGIRVAPRDALISYYSDKSELESLDQGKKSGLNFGIHRTLDTLGAVCGGLLAALLIFIGLTYGQIILWSILPGLIAIIFIFFVKDVKENEILELKALKNKTTLEKTNINSIKGAQSSSERLSPQMKKLILVLSIMEFASVDLAFVMVRSTDVIDANWIILLFAIFNLVSATLATPLGKFTDRMGKQKTISVGLIVLLIISVLLVFPLENYSFGYIIVIFIFPAFGIYTSIVETGSKAFVSDITGKNKKGRVYGLYYFLVGALSIPESLVFAFLYHFYGYQLAFSFSSILLAICIIIFSKADFSMNTEKK